MIRASFFALVLIAAACSPPAEPPPPEPAAPETPAMEAMPQTAAEATARDTCNAAPLRDRVGTPASGVTAPEGARVIAPDTVVTQDFRPDRLNIITDPQGVIVRLECY